MVSIILLKICLWHLRNLPAKFAQYTLRKWQETNAYRLRSKSDL